MNIPGSFFHPLHKFRSFRKFRNFRNSRNFERGFPATLWINFVDFVNGLANYRINFAVFVIFAIFAILVTLGGASQQPFE